MTAPFTKPARVVRQTDRFSRRSVLDEPTTLNIIKVIQGVSGGWTITDAHLSPDNERFLTFGLEYPVANKRPGLFTPRS